MLFHSIQFMVFLPAVFLLYWAVAGHAALRKWVLLLASAVFYMAWNPLPFLIVLYCATADYLLARWMSKTTDPGRRKWLVTVSVVSNLGVLGFFKYANFFYETAATLGGWIGVRIVYHHLDILLPIGLSFVVFQTLSYTIDVYRGDCEARKSWVDVCLFISFFPQIIAGPIVRASWFMPQLDRPASLTEIDGAAALLRIAKGLVKKLLIADLLAANLVDRVFANPGHYTSMEIWAGVFSYTLQIYYDFSAYSDIAIGAAALFGYEISENFNRPYKARDLTEFWKRWHISLSTWLRDYLYIPLGGNRGSKLLTLRNVMITMVLGGIWHGASWRMALWGAVHGVGLCLTRLVWWRFGPPKHPPWWRVSLSWLATFLAVMFARVFFRAESMTLASKIFRGLVPDGLWQAPNVTPRVMAVIAVATILHFGPSDLYTRVSTVFVRLPIPVRAGLLLVIAVVIKNVANFEAQPFIYFQF
ncbi:MAG: MBOAT family protein [Deltaproteobacteria bacterium]|nr:MBOAT family protein [Deltaproteobacteria bacterium]